MNTIYTDPHLLIFCYTEKEIKNTYIKRRKLLQTGHCVCCGENLEPVKITCPYFPDLKGKVLHKGGITKKKQCPRCKTDLIKFCFQDLLDEAKGKADEIIQKAKTAAESIAKNSKTPNKKTSPKKPRKIASNKKDIFIKGQRTLW